MRWHTHRRFSTITEPIKRDALAIHKGKSSEPLENMVVLGDDEGKQRRLYPVRLAAEPTIAVFAAIKIVWRKYHEAQIGQLRRELVVVVSISGCLNDIGGHAASSVLAHHHRPPLARLDVLGHKQDAPCKNILPDVEDHFISNPRLRIIDFAATGVGRQ